MRTNKIDRLIDQDAAEHSLKVDAAPIGHKDMTDQLVRSYKRAILGIDDPNSGQAVMRLHAPNVKQIRNDIGLTQSKLAQLMDVNLSTVQHWEQGTRHPKSTSKIVLEAIAIVGREAKQKSAEDNNVRPEEILHD